MACSLKPAGIGSFSAAANAKVTIQLNSLLGAQMTNVLVTDASGTSTSFTPAGNSVSFSVPLGKSTALFSFALSGAHEAAALVESCGGEPPATQTLAIIQTWNSSGFDHKLTLIGMAPAAAAPGAQAGGQ